MERALAKGDQVLTRLFRVSAVLAPIVLLATASAQPAMGRAPNRADVSINFDDTTAPCYFMDAVALRDQYAALGVRFRGPAPRDGGGVLDQCGSFGVRGHSPPNFLAFHSLGEFADGGIARGPERIRFDAEMSHVEVKVAHGRAGGGSLRLQAYDANGGVVDTAQITLTPELTVIAVDGSAIRLVRVSSNSLVWVLDDLVAS